MDFHREYRIAKNCNNETLFSDILSQHALVMVDAAQPNIDWHHYVQLGTRLGNVQNNWVDRLCIGLNYGDGDGGCENQYRRVVTGVIKNFTNQLLRVLKEDAFVKRDDLIKMAGELHCMHSAKADLSMQKTKRLFCNYVNCLSQMYQCNTEDAYRRSAINCFAVASALGAWLDATIYE